MQTVVGQFTLLDIILRKEIVNCKLFNRYLHSLLIKNRAFPIFNLPTSVIIVKNVDQDNILPPRVLIELALLYVADRPGQVFLIEIYLLVNCLVV